MNASDCIARHEAAGRYFEAHGVRSFVRDEGEGAPVVLMHGVPASCFLYRKVIPELTQHGLRGVAFDLPGLGLSGRPVDYDYSWTGLGRFSVATVDALGLERFHLLVHDIGGPVGFELAAAMPDRILSMTILNTLINVESFQKPWSMRPFGVPVLGELWLMGLLKPMFRMLMRMQGIARQEAVSDAELDAYVELLKRNDGGRAFLQIMRGFETTADKQALYRGTVRNTPYPVQIIWGERDPALRVDVQGRQALEATGLDAMHRLPGRHFLQEDNAADIARLVAQFTAANTQ